MLTFDHQKLVQRQPREMKRFRKYLLGLARGEVAEMLVLHEHDDSCCQQELWPVTLTTIIRAVGAPAKVGLVLPGGSP